MGEPIEPQEVQQISFGSVAIDVQAVKPLPTTEEIAVITLEKTKSDLKWSQFHIHTTERTFISNPGSIGVDEFNVRCAQCRAMLATDEGQAFLAGLASDLVTKPLEARSKVDVVEKT